MANGVYYVTGVKTERYANIDVDDSQFTQFKNLLVQSRVFQTFCPKWNAKNIFFNPQEILPNAARSIQSLLILYPKGCVCVYVCVPTYNEEN